MHEKCICSEFSWSVFSRIRTEYRKIRRISPYSVPFGKYGPENSKYGHFSRNGSFPEKFSSYWPPDLGTLVNSWFLCKNIFLRVIFKRSPRFPPIHSNPKVFWKRWTRTFCKFYRKIPGCNLIHKVNICYYLLY